MDPESRCKGRGWQVESHGKEEMDIEVEIGVKKEVEGRYRQRGRDAVKVHTEEEYM